MPAVRLYLLFTLLLQTVLWSAPQETKELSLGTWSDENSGLYVRVEKAKAGEEEFTEGVKAGNRRVTIGAPPPRAGKADNIFIPISSRYEKGLITVTGAFNWDSDSKNIEMTLQWKDGKALLTIVKNDGYALFPAGSVHTLTREKN